MVEKISEKPILADEGKLAKLFKEAKKPDNNPEKGKGDDEGKGKEKKKSKTQIENDEKIKKIVDAWSSYEGVTDINVANDFYGLSFSYKNQYTMKYETDGFEADALTIIDNSDKEKKPCKIDYNIRLFKEDISEPMNNDPEIQKNKITERIQNALLFKSSIETKLKKERLVWNMNKGITIKGDTLKSEKEIYVVAERMQEEIDAPELAKEAINTIKVEYNNDKKIGKIREEIATKYPQWENTTRKLFLAAFAKAKETIKNAKAKKVIEDIEQNIIALTKDKTAEESAESMKSKKYTDVYLKFSTDEIKKPETAIDWKKNMIEKETYNSNAG